jgi:hypothetical protein
MLRLHHFVTLSAIIHLILKINSVLKKRGIQINTHLIASIQMKVLLLSTLCFVWTLLVRWADILNKLKIQSKRLFRMLNYYQLLVREALSLALLHTEIIMKVTIMLLKFKSLLMKQLFQHLLIVLMQVEEVIVQKQLLTVFMIQLRIPASEKML